MQKNKNKTCRLFLLLGLILFLPSAAYAADYSAGDACSAAGAWHQTNDVGGMDFLICDGSNWKSAAYFSSTGNNLRLDNDPATSSAGCMQYDGTNSKLQYSHDCVTYTDMGAATPTGADRQIQFNSAGAFGADANFVYNAVTGDFIVGSYQKDDTGTGSEDARMFFDKAKKAFRAGIATGTQWDNANVGNYSVALNSGTTASGSGSFAGGVGSVASGMDSFAFGESAIASGAYSFSMGKGTASGDTSRAMGWFVTASGSRSTAVGYEAIAGDGTAGSGFGDYSVAWGMGNALGAYPRVTGDSSFALFMGNQTGYDLTASNTMAVVGGELLIDADGSSPASKGCIRFNDTTDKLQFSHDCSSFSDMGSASSMALDDLTDSYTNYATDFNLIAGRAGAAALTAGAQYNLFFGQNAGATSGNSTATTDRNVAIGYDSLAGLSSGKDNVGIGYRTLLSTTTGYSNVAVGSNSLDANTTGSENTAVGIDALSGNINGWENTAVGHKALISNIGGGANTALGDYTLYANTSGAENTALGYAAMYNSQSGDSNVAVGRQALERNFDSDRNVAVGNDALRYFRPLNSGNTYNVAVGADALMGDVGLTSVGERNTAIGGLAGQLTTTGNDNVFVGYQAGDLTTTGSSNILIGSNVDAPLATTSNHLNIGNTIYGDLSAGKVGIGTATPAEMLEIHKDQAGWTWARVRNDSTAASASVGAGFSVLTSNNELEFVAFGSGATGNDYGYSKADQLQIKATNAARFVLGTRQAGAPIHFITGDTEKMTLDGSGQLGIGDTTPDVALDVVGDIDYTGVITDVSDRRLKENITPLEDSLSGILALSGYSFTMKDDESGEVEYGLIAQDVQPVFPELVKTKPDGLMTLNYIGLIAPLIEATKAQQAEINGLRAANAALEARLETLEARYSAGD